jgi:hypothetical protein
MPVSSILYPRCLDWANLPGLAGEGGKDNLAGFEEREWQNGGMAAGINGKQNAWQNLKNSH